jgi:hypothetical protein
MSMAESERVSGIYRHSVLRPCDVQNSGVSDRI